MTITQGVPQGSVLGPLFYIIYANDLSEIFDKCGMALYADDTVLYTAKKDFCDSVANLQHDINKLTGWCHENGIMVNSDKSKIMVFGSKDRIEKLPEFDIVFGNDNLQTVSSYKYLGITLDSQLNYNLHVRKLIASASGKLKQFQRMRSFLSTRAAVMVYKSMLLPIIEYGDVFLSAATLANRKKLQTLQNKGLRCALNKGIETSSNEMHLEARLHKLKYRREQHTLNLMYDWSLDPSRLKTRPKDAVKTRSSNKRLIKLKKTNSEKFKKSLAYRGPRKWNGLPVKFHTATTKVPYKSLVDKWITQKSNANANANASANANLDSTVGNV